MPQWSLRFRVSPDGQRILAAKSVENTCSRRDPVVVINWADELEAKSDREVTGWIDPQ